MIDLKLILNLDLPRGHPIVRRHSGFPYTSQNSISVALASHWNVEPMVLALIS